MVTIAFANQKGGVGKSTGSREFSYILGQSSKVLYISYDQQRDLEMDLGLYDDVKYTILDVFAGNCSVEEAIIKTNGFDFISADEKFAKAEKIFLESEDSYLLQDLVRDILPRYNYDYVIFDTAPVRNILNEQVLMASDYILIPTDNSRGALNGILKLSEDLNQLKKRNKSKAKILGSYFSNTRRTNAHKFAYSECKLANEQIGSKIFETTIRQSTQLEEAKFLLEPINISYPGSGVALDYRQLVKEVIERIKEEEAK